MSETRSAVPLERDRWGRRILTHGRGGWLRGCGCEVCAAWKEQDRDAKAAAKPEVTPQARRAAKTAAQKARRAAGRGAAKAAGDNRTVTVHVHLTEQAAAALDGRLGRRQTRSAFVREVLEAHLGIEDGVRRQAPRSPDRKRQQREEGQK